MPIVVAAAQAVVAAISAVNVVASTAVAFLAKTAALYAVSRAIAKKPSIPSLRAQGIEVNVRDPAAPRQIIYGQRRVSGIMYPVGVSGTNNEYLHLLVLLAGHECEELGAITFNDETVPLDGSGNATGRYAGFVRVLKHTGAYNQTVDTSLQTDLGSSFWSNNHRLQGIAYLYVRLKVSADLFPGGIPEIYCLVKGRKVYDPRDGGQSASDAATWTWSANAALCLADWIRGVPYRNSAGTIVRNHGVGALDAEIDTAALTAAANICDEDVTLDSGTEDRYTCNGVISTATLPADGIEMLKAAMAGECIYIGGKWVILAGAYRTPTLSFDDGDLRAPLTGMRLKPAVTDLFNVGRGLYMGAVNNWQPTDVPQVRNATYITQDGGELPLDIEFHFTTSHATCQRLLKIAIERSRQGITFVARCKLAAYQAQVGDVIQWTDSDLGWSSKTFEVLASALVVEPDANGQPYVGCDLTLKETASAVWDWANGEESTADPSPNTTLRSPFDIANPTGLSVANSVQQQADGTAVPRLQVSWTAPADANVTARGHIRVEYKLAASSDWLPAELVRGDITSIFILAVVIGQSYDVRVRSENDIFVSPTWVSVTGTTVTGDTTGPAAPTGLAATVGTGKSVSLDWADNTEDDLSEYKVFRNTTNNSGTATEIAEVRASRFVDVDVSLGTQYFYWLKAVDTSENVSAFSGGVNATPTTITDGSVDSTAPSTPSAPTFVSETTYTAGDGTVYARVVIDCPALPSGAKLNQILYRVSGATRWTIADEMEAAGNLAIGDLSPNTAYEFAVRAISFSNVPSAVSSVLSRTAPNKTGAPAAPSGTGFNKDFPPKRRQAGGGYYFGVNVYWTANTEKDIAYYEVKATTTDSDGATDYAWTPQTGEASPNKTTLTQIALYNFTNGAGHVRVRAVNTSGVAGAWTRVGNANLDSYVWMGDMAEQDNSSVNVTGGTATGITDLAATSRKTGNGSSVRAVKAEFHDTTVPTLAGGATTETFNVSLSNRGFSTKPDLGVIGCSNAGNVIAAYDYDAAGNSSTNAVVRVATTDGSNLANAPYRFSCDFVEYD